MAARTLSAAAFLSLPLTRKAGGQLSIQSQIETAISEGRKQRDIGNFQKAIAEFESAAHQAHQTGAVDLEAKAFVALSGCQIQLFQYRAALESSRQAKELASRAADYSLAGAASGNLSTIYYQLGDFPLADKSAAESIQFLIASPRKDFLVKALVNRGDILWDRDNVVDARKSFQQAIAIAHDNHNPKLEALAWDQLGISLLSHLEPAPAKNSLSEANGALSKAVSIEQQIPDEDRLAITREHLAELELRSRNYIAALTLVDQAFASTSQSFKISPQYYPIHIRGQILLALGRRSDALSEFRRAADSATLWRQGALPGDVTSTRTVAHLHDVYEDYAQLAAELSLQNHDRALARQALEVLAENRAASLREQLALAFGRNFTLPPRYFELLSDLQSAQA
ncbi:MAG: hypothetical protein WB992_02785, partial [Bryobacteraceae bacterium]